MPSKLNIYNSLSRKKEEFQPLNPPFVGMYVCGPTVYSDAHLGNLRTFTSFDIVYRYLKYLGYKVRYVRNITDVGHLVDDADEGEDKIGKQAKLEKVEPMEIVQRYTNGFHDMMSQFNCLNPDIEPTATGHIVEQIETIQKIIDNGWAYEVNGSIYFDVKKYSEKHHYGKLSGRNIDEILEGTRTLDGQDEKKNSVDFALWKKASPEHLMRWDSPWGVGFPGWHLECSVMSTKYLGETFDIHGGGLDLKFPHHECEIAQSVGADGNEPVKYWMHTNMLTVNGTKMSKSLGNSFLPHELVNGDHPLLEKGYSPMTVRFFMLQSHYASTLDFTNEALSAAEKGYKRLMKAFKEVQSLEFGVGEVSNEINDLIIKLCKKCTEDLNDDFNTALVLANLFELSNKVNAFANNQLPISSVSRETFDLLQKTFKDFIEDILGLKADEDKGGDGKLDATLSLLIELRKKAREEKDFATSDQIRDQLATAGILLKDSKEGTTWEIK